MTSSIACIIRESASFVMSGSNVRCEFSIPSDLWPVEVDAGQISQVIQNLFINAGQAMPEGGVILTRCENVFIKEGDALPLSEGRYVIISVTDRGGGIPEEYLGKIFDPYFTTKQQGSGLGLASSFSIVKRHDGFIAVESVEGVGTTFTIFLPATQKELSQEAEENKTSYPAKGKILVMDDEVAIRDVLGVMLQKSGYEVKFAFGGEEAIEIYQAALNGPDRFDAVIMDLTIPGGMGGKEAISILREMDPQVKSIVSSGYSNDPVMANFGEYGFSGVLSKPYRMTELAEKLRIILSGTS
jgi:CheY-like chemotaxis protein